MSKVYAFDVSLNLNVRVNFTTLQAAAVVEQLRASPEGKHLLAYHSDGTLDQDGTLARTVRASMRGEAEWMVENIFAEQARKPNITTRVTPRGRSATTLHLRSLDEIEAVLDSTTTPSTDTD